MSDFDRLLNLAQKSNGKIFIYDKSEGRHMMLMDLEEYEEFLDFHEKLETHLSNFEPSFFKKQKEVLEEEVNKDFSDREFIEKINNDIAVWKSKQDEEKAKEEAEDIEEELIKKDWHSISDILNNKNADELEKNGSNELDKLLEVNDQVTFDDKKEIPFVEHNNEFEEFQNLEDGDEPIFLEEPV